MQSTVLEERRFEEITSLEHFSKILLTCFITIPNSQPGDHPKFCELSEPTVPVME
jgi:hypothetical protein